MTKPNQKPPITKIVEGRAKRLLGEFGRPDLIVDGEKEEQEGHRERAVDKRDT